MAHLAGAAGMPAATSSTSAATTTTQRRKWNLEDKSSLSNLRHQVAESGCSHSQYDLARSLLRLECPPADDPQQSNAASSSTFSSANSTPALDSAQHGIYWLMRAADQGHTAAATLLADCWRRRHPGISATNRHEVQTFLAQSQAERAARRAARELFACLAGGDDFITAAQLERRMRQIWNCQRRGGEGGDRVTQGRRRRSSLDGGGGGGDYFDGDDDEDSARHKRCARSPFRQHHHHHHHDCDQFGGCITEAHLVSAAVNYSHGRLPAMSGALQLSAPPAHSLDHIPCFHRLLFHPLTFLLLCYHRVVNGFAALSAAESTVAANGRLCALLLVYALVSSDSWATVAPLGAHFVSLAVMLVSTLRVLKARQEFVDFRMWSGLFLSYDVGGERARVDAQASENLFLRRRMQPYLWFFVAFCGNVMVTPLLLGGGGGGGGGSGGEQGDSAGAVGGNDETAAAGADGGGGVESWMAHSEITVLSFIMVFVTMLAPAGATRPSPDWLLLVSFSVNVLAKYPYEMDSVVTSGWRFVDLRAPNFPSFVLGNGIEFCLSCRALLYLLIPCVLAALARRRRWHGTYQYVIPHCVTLAWLQICIISAQSATWFGLVRAALALAALLLFLPLFGIVTLMIPVFAAVEWLQLHDPTVRLSVTAALGAAAVAASCWAAAHRRGERYVTGVQIAAGIVAAAFLAFPYMTANEAGGGGGGKGLHAGHQQQQQQQQQQEYALSWEQFYEHCQQPAWERENQVRVQLRCALLDGVPISWEGTVAGVEIASVRNVRADWIQKWLSPAIGDWLTCALGQKNEATVVAPLCSDTGKSAGCSATADDPPLPVQPRHRCHLNRWATFEYALAIRMQALTTVGLLRRPRATAEIVVRAAHPFGNFTQQLNVSDRVWFRGRLRNSGGLTAGARAAPGAERRWSMTLGKRSPHVELVAIGCLECPREKASGGGAASLEPPADVVLPDGDADEVDGEDNGSGGGGGGGGGQGGGSTGELRVNGRVRDLYRGVKYLLNVLFNPLVTFK